MDPGHNGTRWLTVKLGVGAVASMAAVGLLSLIVSWWSSQLDYVNADNFNLLQFGARDVVPMGYAAFAFVLGVAAGLIFRRLLPGMMAALIGFGAVREIVTRWVRPYLFAPIHKSLPITTASPLSFKGAPTATAIFERTNGVDFPNTWICSVRIVDNAGRVPTTSFLNRECPLGNYGPVNLRECTARVATEFHQVVTYQPSSNYWPLQWYELAIFLGLSAVLGGLCFWWIRRPIS